MSGGHKDIRETDIQGMFPGLPLLFCKRTNNGGGLKMRLRVCIVSITSLVPRLPRSGMQTLKLCRGGEHGIFVT